MIRPTDKILCCCSWGCNRSVHAKYVLNLRGYSKVLTCGLEHTDLDSLMMLCDWADVVLVVGEQDLMDEVPAPYQYKAKLLPVGIDQWGGWQRQDLLNLIDTFLPELIGQ